MPNSFNLTRYYNLQHRMSTHYYAVTDPAKARYWDSKKDELRKKALRAGWPV